MLFLPPFSVKNTPRLLPFYLHLLLITNINGKPKYYYFNKFLSKTCEIKKLHVLLPPI